MGWIDGVVLKLAYKAAAGNEKTYFVQVISSAINH
jgi:hypothetical protein